MQWISNVLYIYPFVCIVDNTKASSLSRVRRWSRQTHLKLKVVCTCFTSLLSLRQHARNKLETNTADLFGCNEHVLHLKFRSAQYTPVKVNQLSQLSRCEGQCVNIRSFPTYPMQKKISLTTNLVMLNFCSHHLSLLLNSARGSDLTIWRLHCYLHTKSKWCFCAHKQLRQRR